MQNRGIFWSVFGGTIFVDLLTKFFVQNYLLTPLKIFPFLSLKLTENPNLAFGIAFPRFLIIAFSIFALLLIGNIFVKNVRKNSKIGALAFALIFGGAITNLGERIFLGHVTDFISLSIIPNFNVADTALTFGVALIIIFHSNIFKKN